MCVCVCVCVCARACVCVCQCVRVSMYVSTAALGIELQLHGGDRHHDSPPCSAASLEPTDLEPPAGGREAVGTAVLRGHSRQGGRRESVTTTLSHSSSRNRPRHERVHTVRYGSANSKLEVHKHTASLWSAGPCMAFRGGSLGARASNKHFKQASPFSRPEDDVAGQVRCCLLHF